MLFLDHDTWIRRRRNWVGLARNVCWSACNSRHLRLIVKLITVAIVAGFVFWIGTGFWAVMSLVLLALMAAEVVADWKREA